MPESSESIRLGVSSCLLGEEVRFDGGHKHDRYLTETLGSFVEWVPVCPEVEIGLGIPRPTIRLEGDPDEPQLVEPKSGRDLSPDMARYAEERVRELERLDLHGYIFKSKSPSCGLWRVPVHQGPGSSPRRGRGAFAAALTARMPLLPVEEEGRLNDMALRENFIERVFAYRRWMAFVATTPKPKDVVAFHTRHKLTLLSHSRVHYTQLGRLVAQAGTMPRRQLLDEYGATFMAALGVKATTKKHADVLYHMLGFLKKALPADDRAELVEQIEEYRQGRRPLIVPLTLFAHHFRRHPAPWIADQTYLNPYPDELMLRNHV